MWNCARNVRAFPISTILVNLPDGKANDVLERARKRSGAVDQMSTGWPSGDRTTTNERPTGALTGLSATSLAYRRTDCFRDRRAVLPEMAFRNVLAAVSWVCFGLRPTGVRALHHYRRAAGGNAGATARVR